MIFARSWTVYIISYVANPYGISHLHGHYPFACNKGSPKISQMEASMIALPTCKPSYRLYTCHNHWTQVRTRSAHSSKEVVSKNAISQNGETWCRTLLHLWFSSGVHCCTMEVGNLNNSWETKRHHIFSKVCLSSSLGFLETPVSLKELGPCWVEKLQVSQQVEFHGIPFWKKILSYLILLLKWFWSKICILLVYSHPDVLEGILFCHSVILSDQIRI